MLTKAKYDITWEKLPDDFILDDEPVDNINQPYLAAALTESLEIAGRLPDNALTMTNYGVCATFNQKIVVKAPDWGYVQSIRVPRTEVKRSYTPRLEGDIPIIVMEFISDTDGGEYSIKPTYPPGKWFFYERVLEVPYYAIFEPDSGDLEVYQLDDSGRYHLETPDANNHYWIAPMNLFIGVWHGMRQTRMGYWLRFWDENGELLLWGSELVNRERQRAQQERQRAEHLAAQLRAAGIEPEV
ncbi:Uma2 family endonuclease [Limnofasciculus baicalensis]|uniref:Uma2 family endonuclease n=1 Tax=Limnofasciculus baicalensis BBK-W-15 TaxID=2699891 RepID=A0AAE3GV86_9CYAN|nr:Uma2 family endonuclease [Limnofasciculus baicalensis]MCP2730413.1 Uma2 family endonuclease [Limnofasciculus baicalensis BBK-W-15]